MPGNANAKHFLSNVTPCTCLRYADHTDRATLPIGVKGRRKEEKKKRAVPRAAAAYGRQLKMGFFEWR